ncbi:hypothetical protein HWV62_25470 [Athelia sp. TMB]|nr:hypothetical protein HWV62_25470 [Athelia sp. TMB]
MFDALRQRALVLGIIRGQIHNIHGESPKVIPGTYQAEDLHHHLPSGLLFAPCQDESRGREPWFPPIPDYGDVKGIGSGSIVVINPKTLSTQRLALKNFTGIFLTHGIDIYSPEDDPNTVWIFAVNHLPNPEYYQSPKKKGALKARSQIEIFRHVIGTTEAEFVRTVRHPLIRTPNDVFIVNPSSFYVTNDHYYREGFMRTVEDVLTERFGAWTDTVHIAITDMDSNEPSGGIDVTIALPKMHNNNGLGHTDKPNEVAIVDASCGKLAIAERSLTLGATPALIVRESIQLDCCLDNPCYFQDPYATAEHDGSGFILAGLAKAVEFEKTWKTPGSAIPVQVWHVKRRNGEWEKKLIFQDDGKLMRSAATAVMVAVDPSQNGGRRQGDLFVTGPLADAIVVSRVDL